MHEMITPRYAPWRSVEIKKKLAPSLVRPLLQKKRRKIYKSKMDFFGEVFLFRKSTMTCDISSVEKFRKQGLIHQRLTEKANLLASNLDGASAFQAAKPEIHKSRFQFEPGSLRPWFLMFDIQSWVQVRRVESRHLSHLQIRRRLYMPMWTIGSICFIGKLIKFLHYKKKPKQDIKFLRSYNQFEHVNWHDLR